MKISHTVGDREKNPLKKIDFMLQVLRYSTLNLSVFTFDFSGFKQKFHIQKTYTKVKNKLEVKV